LRDPRAGNRADRAADHRSCRRVVVVSAAGHSGAKRSAGHSSYSGPGSGIAAAITIAIGSIISGIGPDGIGICPDRIGIAPVGIGVAIIARVRINVIGGVRIIRRIGAVIAAVIARIDAKSDVAAPAMALAAMPVAAAAMPVTSAAAVPAAATAVPAASTAMPTTTAAAVSLGKSWTGGRKQRRDTQCDRECLHWKTPRPPAGAHMGARPAGFYR